MSPLTQERTATGWFDAVLNQLDQLQRECVSDEESMAPPASRFEMAKQEFGNLRIAAAFPNIPTPRVWAGINGEIVIAFDFPQAKLELIIYDRMNARVLNQKGQIGIETANLPKTLQALAA